MIQTLLPLEFFTKIIHTKLCAYYKYYVLYLLGVGYSNQVLHNSILNRIYF